MSSRRRKILFVTPSWPLGPIFGGQLRALHTARSLRQLGEVSVLVTGSSASDRDAQEKTKSEFHVEPSVLPTEAPNSGIIQKLRWAIDIRYLNVHGYLASNSDRKRMLILRNGFDLVWLLNSRTPNIFNIWNWPRTHLDIDDIPSTYYRSIAKSAKFCSQRIRARFTQLLLKRREDALPARFTTLSVCSRDDRQYLGARANTHVIPNGFARPEQTPSPHPHLSPPRIGFIGLYSYAPNIEGVRWFLREAWPLIRDAVPGIRFRLIGKDTDGPLTPSEPDIDALGWVSDPADEIATWSLMVIPVRIGGGTRIKIVDAFSRKCPVVSTTLGAFGYEVISGKHLLIANCAKSFSAACIDLVRDQQRAKSIAESAWNEFCEKWTWDAISPKVTAAAEDCLRHN